MKYHRPILFVLLLIACCVNSCTNHEQQELFNRVESIIEAHPDSALSMLNGIDRYTLDSKKDKARYALLMSMALDKNYIDTTSFEILQPAIDYYLKNGNPDERLKTYYYQGCIFLNRGDKDNALSSFTKGLDNMAGSNDSLCITRALVAQARLYLDFYDLECYTTNYLKAADIYHLKGNKDMEFDCLLNALNGSIILEDKQRADSLINLCSLFESLSDRQQQILYGYQLSYTLNFGTNDDLKKLIDSPQSIPVRDTNSILNLASAYSRLGKNKESKQLLDSLSSNYPKYNISKYQSIYISILESQGNYKEALSVYKDFMNRIDSIHTFRFDQKSRFIEEQHSLELKAQQDASESTRIIWSCIAGLIFLFMVVIILFLLFRSNKAQKNLVIEKARRTGLENEKLKSERENLALENKNLQLERDKKALEAENLTHLVKRLESESESLKELMETKKELPIEVRKAITVRIEMLNSLLAGYITDNIQHGKHYESWVKEHTDNTDEFMNSNRLAFQVSHPRFIRYFEDHGLTVSEINYVCLYAIGLRGKEVGAYLKKPSHVNMSSAIRKKLGIDKHETNIGIYVRKLLKAL